MAKIDNIEKTRDFILKTLEKLDSGKIDANEAGIAIKGCEGVMSSCKLQLMYNNMRGETPNIKFLQKCNSGKLMPIKVVKEIA